MNVPKKEITADTPIDYRYFNMDTGEQVSEKQLQDYRIGKTGTTRCIPPRNFLSGGPVLIGFGSKWFEYEDLEGLNYSICKRV